MVNLALKLAALSALGLAAAPAQSAVRLASAGSVIGTAGNPFRPAGADRVVWYEKRSDSSPPVLLLLDFGAPSPGLSITPPRAMVSILPEPRSWAMMFAGLAAVGCALRSLHKRRSHTVSFV
jgi:hypothetical protein